RPNRITGHAIERVEQSLLRGLCNRFDGASIDRDIDQHWSAWYVEVPDAVMDQLIMPFALAGFQIDGHEGLSKQSIAGSMAPVDIAGRQLDRQIRQAEFFVHADLSPHPSIADVVGGIIQPGVASKLARLRDGVKYPKTFARTHIE